MTSTRQPGYETRDVSPRVPLGAAVLALTLLALILALVAGAFALRGGGGGAPTADGFSKLSLGGVDTPSLQADPSDDVSRMRAISEQGLHEYGWVDQQAGIVHLPIERALELYVRRHGEDAGGEP